MNAALLLGLASTCAPAVHVDTAHALVLVESGLNPWAIGVVGGELLRQPRTRAEATATARRLQAKGLDYSVGLGQINARNFSSLGLTIESAFDPCLNLSALQAVLIDCFKRASATSSTSPQVALRQALSCYYSGNFTTGFHHGYVSKVVSAARRTAPSTPTRMKEKT
jgi:type IV secretion system protein VirB1